MMIQVTVHKKNQRIVSFEMTGHANFSEHGSDIVCAGVSALAITTVNSIEKLAGYQPIVEVDEVEGGYLYMEVVEDLTKEQEHTTQILLNSLLLEVRRYSIGISRLSSCNFWFIHSRSCKTFLKLNLKFFPLKKEVSSFTSNEPQTQTDISR